MSEVDDAIAIGNFKIDAFERFVRLQLETAERQAGIAEKWEDVTKKHLENDRFTSGSWYYYCYDTKFGH